MTNKNNKKNTADTKVNTKRETNNSAAEKLRKGGLTKKEQERLFKKISDYNVY